MSARTVLVTLGLSAWLLASAVAFLIVAYTTFFGIAVIGLAICYVSTRFELDADTPVASSLNTSFLAAQLQDEAGSLGGATAGRAARTIARQPIGALLQAVRTSAWRSSACAAGSITSSDRGSLGLEAQRGDSE